MELRKLKGEKGNLPYMVTPASKYFSLSKVNDLKNTVAMQSP